MLVVEDDFLIQMFAMQCLEDRSLKADVAGSATDALNKLGLILGSVDAVVVDLSLPDRTGDVLLREIRALFPTIPVVLASGAEHANVTQLAGKYPRTAIVIPQKRV